MHIDHKAGDKLVVDFTGEIIPVEIFIATLGTSSFTEMPPYIRTEILHPRRQIIVFPQMY
jgi:hypothetical protein